MFKDRVAILKPNHFAMEGLTSESQLKNYIWSRTDDSPSWLACETDGDGKSCLRRYSVIVRQPLTTWHLGQGWLKKNYIKITVVKR